MSVLKVDKLQSFRQRDAEAAGQSDRPTFVSFVAISLVGIETAMTFFGHADAL
jgi:hypothetical protein